MELRRTFTRALSVTSTLSLAAVLACGNTNIGPSSDAGTSNNGGGDAGVVNNDQTSNNAPGDDDNNDGASNNDNPSNNDGDGPDPPDELYEMPDEGVCADEAGCLPIPYDLSGPRTTYWKVTLERTPEGDVSVMDLTAMDLLDEVGPPPASPGGDLMLEGRNSAGERVSLTQARFHDLVLTHEGLGTLTEETITDEPLTAVAYLPADESVQELALLDMAMNEVAVVPLDEVAERQPFGTVQQGLGEATACAHVEFPGRDQRELAAPGARAAVISPPPYHKALVQRILDGLPQMRCVGVQRVFFIYDDELSPGFVNKTIGGTIHMNLGATVGLEDEDLFSGVRVLTEPLSQAMFVYSFVHETGHVAHNLLDQFNPDSSIMADWELGPLGLAFRTLERHRLVVGLLRGFSDIQRRAFELGAGANYATLSPDNATTEQLVAQGFMSYYGGSNLSDDIAETATWPIVRDIFNDQGLTYASKAGTFPTDYGCQQLSQPMTSVGLDNAVVLTKLNLLQSLGLITEEQLQGCTGGTELIDVGPGFHVYTGGGDDIESERSFTDDLEGHIITREDKRGFQVSATGIAVFGQDTYPATMTLRLLYEPIAAEVIEVSWPRGLFNFAESLTLGNENFFAVVYEGNGSATYYAYDGWVLVTEASNQRISGSVVVSHVFRPLAPIPVPETFDPPLRVRFVLDNGGM